MNSKSMKAIGHCGTHECAPKDWRSVPALTGDYDFDATIAHRSNSDLPARLKQHVKRNAYEIQNGYNAYRTAED